MTVVSRLGTLPLNRQVFAHADGQPHVIPSNAVLPAHHGVILTRGLQEWACLLPQELPFASVARLLGWQTQEADVLGATTIRSLVRAHGQLLRRADQAAVATVLGVDDQAALTPVLTPHDQPRRRAGWPAELNAAVAAALASEQVRPPQGVSWTDWERVLAARRVETATPIETLRHLGPRLADDDVLLTIDEVLTPKADGTGRWELRTAKLMTPQGYRYLSGTGEAFLQTLLTLTLVAVGRERALLLLSDEARWIRDFFDERLAGLPGARHLLDWYHLEAKCRDLSSRICRDKAAKGVFLRRLYRRLWAGRAGDAVTWLERYRRQAKNPALQHRPPERPGQVGQTLVEQLLQSRIGQRQQGPVPGHRGAVRRPGIPRGGQHPLLIKAMEQDQGQIPVTGQPAHHRPQPNRRLAVGRLHRPDDME